MERQLRPRKSRPSYATLISFDDDEDQVMAGPSRKRVLEDDADSGSDFALDEKESAPDPEDDALSAAPSEAEEDEAVPVTPTKKGKVKKSSRKTPIAFTPGLSRPSNRHVYALPTPSFDHRHRALPLYSNVGLVERLDAPPRLFAEPTVVLTNNFTSSTELTKRLSKAWGLNVGVGPLWDLMEDRGWYKEAREDAPPTEANRRPCVHATVRLGDGWEIVDADRASQYLPSDTTTVDEGPPKPPPPVACSFGPVGHQTRLELGLFDSIRLSEYLPESPSHVFNAGGPIWGLDWCPIHPDERTNQPQKHYLAVAPYPSQTHSPEIGDRVQRPYNACIQIWTLGPAQAGGEDDRGEMHCEMVLCLESGPAHEIKWCPLPSHDPAPTQADSNKPRKLGLLAGTFADGSLSIYAVPHPSSITPSGHDGSCPVYVRMPEPLVRIELEETTCWTLDWANSEVLAIGCTNGCIAIYDIGEALRSGARSDILPTHYMAVHQSAVRALAWVRAPSGDVDPTVLASGAYDGVECITDIREPHGNVVNRTRDVIMCMSYSPYSGALITIDHENMIKSYSLAPATLGRGHVLLDPSGPAWSISTSDYHPQIAVGAADGACFTTNTLRSTKRGGAVPFFVHKIFQLDYSRNTGEFRMLDRFLPSESNDRSTYSRAAAEAAQSSRINGTGVWPAPVGVHRVAWHDGAGLARAPLLASGTAAGLGRVDWLLGRWVKDRVPYGGVSGTRMEEGEIDKGDGDVEDDDDDSD